ncbi:hypothetical protein M1D96_05450 [Pseudomonas sp. D1-3]
MSKPDFTHLLLLQQHGTASQRENATIVLKAYEQVKASGQTVTKSNITREAEIFKSTYQGIAPEVSDVNPWLDSKATPIEEAVTFQYWMDDNSTALNSLTPAAKTETIEVAKQRFTKALLARLSKPDTTGITRPRGCK